MPPFPNMAGGNCAPHFSSHLPLGRQVAVSQRDCGIGAPGAPHGKSQRLALYAIDC